MSIKNNISIVLTLSQKSFKGIFVSVVAICLLVSHVSNKVLLYKIDNYEYHFIHSDEKKKKL